MFVSLNIYFKLRLLVTSSSCAVVPNPVMPRVPIQRLHLSKDSDFKGNTFESRKVGLSVVKFSASILKGSASSQNTINA